MDTGADTGGGTPGGAAALADELLGRLLDEPDPVTRWRALAELAGRLHTAREVTVRQLLADGRSRAQAGQVLGVSKGRVSQLAAGPAAPGPAQAWGRVLAVAGLLAELGERRGGHRLAAERDRLTRTGLARPQPAQVTEAAHRWAAAARRNRQGVQAGELLARMETLLADAAGLPAELAAGQRGQAALGYHTERAEQAGRATSATGTAGQAPHPRSRAPRPAPDRGP